MSVSTSRDEGLSLGALVARSRRLGPPRVEDLEAIPVELVEDPADAAAEGYVTAIEVGERTTRVELVLDHGLRAVALLPALEAEWHALAEGQIVAVRLDRWLDF